MFEEISRVDRSWLVMFLDEVGFGVIFSVIDGNVEYNGVAEDFEVVSKQTLSRFDSSFKIVYPFFVEIDFRADTTLLD